MKNVTDKVFKEKYENYPMKEQILYSESGKFFVDNNGQLIRFEPNELVFIKENTCIRKNYTFTTKFTIHTLIIPEGIQSFSSDSFRYLKVLGSLVFPHSLESIGTTNHNPNFPYEQMCVFANCILPKVIIPANIKELGNFAFGNSYIEELVLPTSIRSIYARQFKDSYIKKLFMPEEYKVLPDGPDFGWLRWYSTQVEGMVYYKPYDGEGA